MRADKDQLPGVSEHTGFPNAATDRSLATLDLHTLLVKNPTSTFFMRVDSNQWADRSIYDGDIAVIDRALNPRQNDVAVLWREGEFTILNFAKVGENDEIWGIITTVIHQLRK